MYGVAHSQILREGMQLVVDQAVQRGTKTSPDVSSFMEMGGREVNSEKNSRATETAVRGFWHGYRQIMAF